MIKTWGLSEKGGGNDGVRISYGAILCLNMESGVMSDA